MAKDIILIADAASIFVNSIADGLKLEGFDCSVLTTKNISAETLMSENTLEILWLNDELSTDYETMQFLKNLYSRHKKKLFLYGYANQLELVTDYMPNAIIADVFERPITAHEIAERLMRQSKNGSADSAAADANRKKHILVVDDSGPMLRTIKGWLEPRYRVSIVNSATNAISFLSQHKPDLILLDYEMPVCSGPMLMQMIRAEESTKSIPIIFLTAKGDRECVETAIALSPNGYLLKSMRPAEIVNRIDAFFIQGL